MNRQRYSILAPFTLEQRIELTIAALNFFSPRKYKEMCHILGKTQEQNCINPFNGRDFLNYLKNNEKFPDAARYQLKIAELLTELAKHNLLREVGRNNNDILFGNYYYFLLELTSLQQKGILWLARALGAEFLYNAYTKATVQITGITKENGDVHAGTGLVIAPHWILTCAHVINDMEIDKNQFFFGAQHQVIRSLAHPKVDVGLLEIKQPMQPLPDIAFRDPVVAESVFTLGYPRIPQSRESVLVIQRGEVTNSSTTLFDERVVFLYSAIARPGNSGGPILSEMGHIVGIVTEELSEQVEGFLMPFYAGTPTRELVKALADLDDSITLPVESYE